MDINSLREREIRDTLSVSDLNKYIGDIIRNNKNLSVVSVRGEISNFVRHYSGHIYFSLKDSGSQIKAVLFRSNAERLKFSLENGMKVVLRGSVNVYEKDGSYQIYVTSVQPDGVGALYLAYEQLKTRLYEEGLFDRFHKKSLPRYPVSIGVVTSPTGAVIRDIINVIERRFPLVNIYLYPAKVQGEGASSTLIKGIDYFDKSGLVDLVIIGRGGGSIEDLWEFNSEALARRIFEADIPIISAVGHETDFTICDFVADLRAPTPSAAAELAVPDAREITMHVNDLFDRAEKAITDKTSRLRDKLSSYSRDFFISKMLDSIEINRNKVEELSALALVSINGIVTEQKNAFKIKAEKLNLLNPLSVLGRGYSVVRHEGSIISKSEDLSLGDRLEVILGSGSIAATVTEIREEKNNGNQN